MIRDAEFTPRCNYEMTTREDLAVFCFPRLRHSKTQSFVAISWIVTCRTFKMIVYFLTVKKTSTHLLNSSKVNMSLNWDILQELLATWHISIKNEIAENMYSGFVTRKHSRSETSVQFETQMNTLSFQIHLNHNNETILSSPQKSIIDHSINQKRVQNIMTN